MTNRIIILIVVLVVIVLVCKVTCGGNKTKENYIDPIWMNKKKMYDDYYPRSNGSIYGTYLQPYDFFSGMVFYSKAY
jgi:hypothetical protein